MIPKFPFFTAQQLNLDWVMQTLKKILSFMPIDAGAVGDVLQRKANGAAWEPLAAASLDIHGLQTAEEVAADDEIPIYDKTATGNRKVTVAAIRAGVSSPVTSVNGHTGAVVLDAADVGLDNVDNVQQYSASNPPPYPVTSVNGQTGAVVIPTGGGGAVDSVNGMTGAVVLGKSDVGLANVDNVQQYSATNPPPYPVTSVNGQTGAVVIPTGGGSPVLLWTNSTPLNAFASQSLSIDLSAYKFIVIEFAIGHYVSPIGTVVVPVPTYSPPVGYASRNQLCGIESDGAKKYLVERSFSVTTTGIAFNSGVSITTYYDTNVNDDTLCRPLRIWGIA